MAALAYFSSLLPIAMLGLALGVVQPTTVIGRAPRPAGAGIERSVNGGSLRLRPGGNWDPVAAIAEPPFGQLREQDAASLVFAMPVAVLAPSTAWDEPVWQVIGAASCRAESPGSRRPSGPRLGRAPPVA